ncbi:methyl-accepting chemotaxis sensory transducer with Pas/Pac sensor [Vogesella indigofera]|uniref:Methyl-accepting chemotaxis sensory transducer with Pas/Pac sensor n=2 Tax=Vogesella indigofera TaxID=45465 RepID=A0A495BHV2_VOGIN|nr:methyl-accepting chemotaxis sensory transducer with Pas/Pac sensor [Vogesella indigofera]
MKINMPVTANELFLDPLRPIVTKTDLKGAITYANRAFIDISGFSEAELLGKNHNIVRHPDMPAEAFADLWDTVKQGKPWGGLVKNRAKNGDFYWVEAHVTPITEMGKIVGYVSVRSTPNRAEVSAAEALYQKVRDKQATLPSTLKQLSKRRDSGKIGFVLTGLFSSGLVAAGCVPGWSDGTRLLVSLLSLGALAAASVWWRYSEWRVMQRLHQGFLNLAEGQLESPLQTRLGGQLGAMMDSLEGLRLHMRAMVADSLSAGGRTYEQSHALSQEMGGLVARAEEQGKGLQQISISMEQISSSIGHVASMAQDSVQGAQETRNAATEGQQVMQRAAEAATQAVVVVNRSKEELAALDKSMTEIGAMTNLIHGIAEQTNLLALNAAIEAARAGETGRGFAVVADEVRKLAERTATATDAIGDVVQQIVQITDKVTLNMDRSVEEVDHVSAEIRASASQLDVLLDIADRAHDFAGKLSSQVASDSSTVHQVAASVEQLAVLGEQNIDTANNVLHSAQALEVAAGDLERLTLHYRKWQKPS